MYGSQNLIVFGFQSSGGGTPTPVDTIYSANGYFSREKRY